MKLSLLPQQTNCAGCELHEHVAPTSVGIGTISLTPDPSLPALVFIGQNPGWYESQCAQPFVSKSGVMVRGGWWPTRAKEQSLMLAASTFAPNVSPEYLHRNNLLGLPRDALPSRFSSEVEWQEGSYIDELSFRTRSSIFLTNAIRCWTLDNSTPLTRHIRPCSSYLLTDLTSIIASHPRTALILLGYTAVRAIYDYIAHIKGIRQLTAFSRNGETLHLPCGPCTIFSTYHPAYLLRNPNVAASVQDHLQLVSDWLDNITVTESTPTLITPRVPSDK